MTKRTYALQNREEAWEFMWACDDADVMAGFPSLTDESGQGGSSRSVEVGTRTDAEVTCLERVLKKFPNARLIRH